MTQQNALETLNFEDALAQLEGIVRDLEKGATPLEKSIDSYERGMALKLHCEGKLREAQARIEKIAVGKDGKLSVKPLDGEA